MNDKENREDLRKLQIQDPELAHVMSELITVDAVASVSLLASAGSRASNLLEEFRGHIMEPNGNFGSIMTNIRTLDAADGPYRSWLRAMKVNPATPDPPDDSPSAARARGGATSGSAASRMDADDDEFMKKFYRNK